MANKNKSTKKVAQAIKNHKASVKSNIIGISLLLGVLSIGYSSAYIIMGTNGWVPIVLVAPQMLLGSVIAAIKFCK